MDTSKITGPGVGGASAVLLIWYMNHRWGLDANNEQAAALASMFTVLFGFAEEIGKWLKQAICGVYALIYGLIYKVPPK